jgi:hypothetical protein
MVTEMQNRELTAVIGAYKATATTDPPNLNLDATFGMPAFTQNIVPDALPGSQIPFTN